MFTGLVEAIGQVTAVAQDADGSRISVSAPAVLGGMALGDSMAIDGACTTVIAFNNQGFTIEASRETLAKTTFGTLKPGTHVNLERPLTPSSRIGGHYVTGHVDGVAHVVSRQPDGLAERWVFAVEDDALAAYLVPKGSIAVAGISLTINHVDKNTFGVAIIPHTLAQTTLAERQIGDAVNIETDLLGKYVHKFLGESVTI